MAIENSDIQPLLDEIAKVEDEQYRAVLLAAVEEIKVMHTDADIAELGQDLDLDFANLLAPVSHPLLGAGLDPTVLGEHCAQIVTSLVSEGGE